MRPTDKSYSYQCTTCLYTAKKRVAVISHIQSTHIDFPGYTCVHCGSLAKTLNAFQQHKLKCHKKY